MSRATSFASVMQQVSLSLGVAIGALVLQAGQVLQGETHVSRGDFAAAFWIVAAIGLLSVISFLRLAEWGGEGACGAARRGLWWRPRRWQPIPGRRLPRRNDADACTVIARPIADKIELSILLHL